MRRKNTGNIAVKILMGLTGTAVLVLALLTLIQGLTTRYIPAMFAAGAFFFLGFVLTRPERGEKKIPVKERVYFGAVSLLCLALAAVTAVTVWELV